MARRRAIPVGRGGIVHTAFTGVADGDLRVTLPPEQLAPRRAAIAPGEWTWLDQVHGADVVRVGAPGQHAGAPADAAVTDVPNAVLAVHTADCAGVLLWGTGDGVVAVGAAHAGWRGLHDGVLESTVAELRALGAVDVHYCLGPCISPGSYEFGEEDLDRLVTRFGPGVASRTREGRPALDLRAGVRAALDRCGAAEHADGPDRCTATEPGHYSWRARRDEGRQAAVVWIDGGRASR